MNYIEVGELIIEKVTVVVTAFNDEEYIIQCINSVINQTYKNIEVIVINDGSKDDTAKILEEINFKNVRVINNECNSGPSVARNVGISLAEGEFITFVDGDDYVSSTMVECLVKTTIDNDADISVGGFQLFRIKKGKFYNVDEQSGENRVVVGKKAIFAYLYPFFDTNKVNPPVCKLYKLSIIRANGIYFDESIDIGEDFVFNLYYYTHVQTAAFIKGDFYKYRRGKNYLTSKYSGSFNENKFKMFSQAEAILIRANVSKSFLDEKLLKICFSYFMELPFRLKESTKDEKLKIISDVCSEPRIKQIERPKGSLVYKIFFKFINFGDSRAIYQLSLCITVVRRLFKLKK